MSTLAGKIVKALLVVVMTGTSIWAWYHLLILIPASEWLWTRFNSLTGGGDPGLAYDLEFLAVAVFALLSSWLIAGAALRWLGAHWD